MRYKIDEIVQLIMDYRGKTPKKLGMNWTESQKDIIALSAKNIKDNKIVNTDKSHYGSELLYKHWMKDGDIEPGDILMTSEAPLGEVYLVSKPIKAILSQRLFLLRFNKKIVNPWYMYAFMNSQSFKNQLLLKATGTTVVGIKQKDLRKIEVELPNIELQNKIGSIFQFLDKKIHINGRINDNLDDLLTLIFEKFAINMKFEKSNLVGIANFKNGLPMQKFQCEKFEDGIPVLKIRELSQGYTDSSSDRCSMKINKDYIVKTGDIVFSWSGTLMVKIWSGTTSGLNQHLFKVTSKKFPSWFIYEWTKHYLKKFKLIAAGKATTMGHIQRSDLMDSIVFIPNYKFLSQLTKIMKPIYDERIKIIKQNQHLNCLKKEFLTKYF